MSKLQEIVTNRLAELDLGPVEAAVAAGMERTYIRDIVKGKKQTVTAGKIGQLAKALKLEPEPLARNEAVPAKELASMPAPNASFPPRYQAFPDDVSIPLRGQIAAGPNGRFILNGQDIARVFCPPGLEGVEGAYAVQIQGTSGEPRFYQGETAWVNPHARYRQGDDVIVQVLGDDADDEVYSYIKRFVSETKDLLRLYQYNPGQGEEHDLEFPRRKVFSIQKVVFHAML